MFQQWLSIFFFGILLFLSAAATANSVRGEHVEAELVAEVAAVRPGEAFWVGLRLKPDKHWKTYWRNPGGSGLATTIDWRLPEGTSASPIHWPYPERFEVQGIISYGYGHEVLLLTRIEPGENLKAGENLPIQATASWLACYDICIPGSAELSLSVPVDDAPPPLNPRRAAAFETARQRLPIDAAHWRAGFAVEDNLLHLEVEAREPVFAKADAVSFFPYEQYLLSGTTLQSTEWKPGRFFMKQEVYDPLTAPPGTVAGVILVQTDAGNSAYRISATKGLLADTPESPLAGEAVIDEQAPKSLIIVMVLAMAGGLLLNLMPCVFPVLSLKAIALMEAFNVSDRGHHLHGIAYTLGVMSFFCAVAGVLYLFKASGAAVGWGFQLQMPWFVALLAYLLFVLGLSFSGLLEFGASFMGVGDSLTRRGGYIGSFFTGALAAVVASPCTAPFMGSAIAYAIVQPPLYSLLVFMALGFGMALPFLLIGYMPQLGRILPRPGPWMDIFKQLMAFPLYLTSIWLLWVLGRQTGATGMAVVLIGMMLITLAIWLQRLKPRPEGIWRKVNLSAAAVCVVAALGALTVPVLQPDIPVTASVTQRVEKSEFWQAFSAERLAELRAEGRAVFVNMTADWCISCIANERVALSFPSVRQAMTARGIVPLKGDWTNNDPEISAVLESFGRSGVPLYVLYPSGNNAEPVVLPQWLSPGSVKDAVNEMALTGASE